VSLSHTAKCTAVSPLCFNAFSNSKLYRCQFGDSQLVTYLKSKAGEGY